MKIKGSTFLITGGGSGLGAGSARRLAAEGANVVLADIDRKAGSALAAELGEKARFVHTDVTDEAQVQTGVQTAIDSFGDYISAETLAESLDRAPRSDGDLHKIAVKLAGADVELQLVRA